MFRAIAGFMFIIIISVFAVLLVSIAMKALGVSGLLAFIVGLPVFIGTLTAAIVLLELINNRINNKKNSNSLRNNHLHKS